jgi:hypothetical protein
MKMTLLGVAAFAAHVAPAWATMPLLGEKPPMRTDEACWAWADQQAKDDETAFMWGILDDGNTDRAVAVRRLADDCLGQPKPEIVGFGSSAGFDRDYCRSTPKNLPDKSRTMTAWSASRSVKPRSRRSAPRSRSAAWARRTRSTSAAKSWSGSTRWWSTGCASCAGREGTTATPFSGSSRWRAQAPDSLAEQIRAGKL